MGLLDFRKKEVREEQTANNAQAETQSDPLLQAIMSSEEVDREKIMNIPSVSACVNKIADTVSSLDIKLYRRKDGKIEEVTDDIRTFLLNEETGDTLDAVQFKKAMIVDMYLSKGGYAFVKKVGSKVKSIHYVDARNVSFSTNDDPIFKDYQVIVNAGTYEGWQFIKLLRSTQNGYSGKSIIEESPTLLSIVYSTQLFERNMVKTGGNKKGFIQSTTRLTKEAMTALKNAFRNLYSNNSENVVILNDGLSFKESSNSSVELQLNENKETNNDDICKIFLIPPSIINGGASEEDKKQYIDGCILPILHRFERAIDSVLLNEDEKEQLFFAFDTSDLIKGDIEKRFNAYKTALDAGFMQLDEVRKNEKLPEFGLNFIKLGLQDVLYYPDKDAIYTPNTNKLSKMNESDADNAEDAENVESVEDVDDVDDVEEQTAPAIPENEQTDEEKEDETRATRGSMIIVGSPCSGKSTFLESIRKDDDIVIDVDQIRTEVAGGDAHGSTQEELVSKVLKIRDEMIDDAVENGKNALIITTSTDFDRIYSWKTRLDAELHMMATTEDECIARLEKEPQGRDVEKTKKLISKYYKNLPELKNRLEKLEKIKKGGEEDEGRDSR